MYMVQKIMFLESKICFMCMFYIYCRNNSAIVPKMGDPIAIPFFLGGIVCLDMKSSFVQVWFLVA
jgi:hypothetical protein